MPSDSENAEEFEDVAKNLLEEKEQAYTLIKSKIEVLDVKFHPTESQVVTTALLNGKIKIYDLSEKRDRMIGIKKLHKKSIRKIDYAVNNTNHIFTASKDKSIKLTDLRHEQTILHLENAHDSPVNCFKVVDYWLVASADDNGTVKLWDYRRKNAAIESKECGDYISDLAVSQDKKILLATSGEGTLTAYHIKGKKMLLQSELMDSEMLSVAFVKNDKYAVCGTGEGVINIFNYDEWGNISDRFPGHPSSIDCILPISNNIILTGCFDGNIRACSVFPNRFLGVVGSHNNFPITSMSLSCDGNIVASISHNQQVKFWDVEAIKAIKVDAQSKSENKKLKNKKIVKSGKSDNFFADLDDRKDGDGSDSDDDSDEEDSGEEENESDNEEDGENEGESDDSKDSEADENDKSDEEEEDDDSDVDHDDDSDEGSDCTDSNPED